MTKKFVLILLLILMTMNIGVDKAFGSTIDYNGHWAEEYIQEFIENGYAAGYPDGSFKPEGFVTRAEFIKLVNSTFGFEEKTAIEFVDVNTNDWYYSEVQKAYSKSYISGISSDEFAPNDLITREQAAVILNRIVTMQPDSLIEANFIDNNNISEWAIKDVLAAVSNNLIIGYADNSFRPQNPVKRAEAVLMLQRALDCMPSDEDSSDTIKVLAIGNSFSQDMVYYLHDMAKSAGINVVVANLYNSGCSLERHWEYATQNKKAYTYYKWESDQMTKSEGYTMKRALLDEKWDYITLQQSSAYSGLYSTFQPYLNNLATHLRENSRNKDVKLALNMTWAYSKESTNDGFFYYHYNQNTMYNAIVNSYMYALNESGINILIPCGTAIQNARTNKYLNAIGKELTNDGYHLDTGVGRYIAGLTVLGSIMKEEKLNLNLDHVKFVPDSKEISSKLISLSKKAVNSAIENPYEVKTIK
jgi:hypothetical protein